MQDTTFSEMTVSELEEVRGGGAFTVAMADAATWVEGAAESVKDYTTGLGRAVTNS